MSKNQGVAKNWPTRKRKKTSFQQGTQKIRNRFITCGEMASRLERKLKIKNAGSMLVLGNAKEWNPFYNDDSRSPLCWVVKLMEKETPSTA